NAVEMTAGEGVLSMVDGALMGTVVLAVLLFAFSWKLTLLALLPWPIMAYLMWRFGNELHRAFRDAQAQFSALNDRVQESIATIRLIKAFGQEARETGAFAQAVDRAGHANLEVARIDAKYDPTIFLTIGSSFLLTVGGGAWLIHHGEMTLGELTSFTMYLSYLIWPMFAFGWLLNIVERGSAAYARIEQLLNTKPDIDDAGHLTALPAPPRIEFMVHRFAYPGARHEVLRDVQAVVPAGATLGIVGPTGAGKTTLLNLLLRLVEAPTTEVRIAGHSVRDYRLETLRAAIALVPQDPFLFSATVAENIALGRPEATLEEIRAAARSACIDDEIMAFPDQYDTLVGERGMTLSGGQKQRIAIARALLLDAPILVLDDVLSAVDVKTETRILQHLRALRRGRTTLIVSHRLSAVAEADHIIVLRHGRIVEQGSHDELLAADGWYAQMFRYQQIERAVAEGR
ncbi:MAG: ATP-binding cassette domain-containing protein, partial [Gammaproteobacteria bacterium]